MYWVSLPFIAYLITLFIAALAETIFGRGTIGTSAFDEYLVVIQIMIILSVIRSIKRKI